MNGIDPKLQDRMWLQSIADGWVTGSLTSLRYCFGPHSRDELSDLAKRGLITLGAEGPQLTEAGVGVLSSAPRPSDAWRGLGYALLIVALMVAVVAVWWWVL